MAVRDELRQKSIANDAGMKNKSSQAVNSPKKITDYFMRNKASSAGSTVAPSASPSYASLRRRDSQKGEEPTAARKSSRLIERTGKNESIMITSSKRVRSPDIVSPQSKNTTSGERSRQSKRHRKFDNDSDVEMLDSAVMKPLGHVGKPSRASPVEQMSAGRFETVPTSQPDELELDSAYTIEGGKWDKDEVRKCVEQWRRQASRELPDARSDEDSEMQELINQMSSPLPSVPSTPKSLLSDHSNGAGTGHNSSIPSLPTPPVSEDVSRQSSPQPPTLLDERSTTEFMLEKIKSEVLAKVQIHQDSPPPQFDEVLDSSSEEELLLPLFIGRKEKEKRKPHLNTPDYRQKYPYSLRSRRLKVDQPGTVPSNAGRNFISQNVTKSKRSYLKKVVAKEYNPLDALLAEKRKLQKAGKDVQAVIQAESVLKAKQALREEDLGSDEILDKWLDERSAQSMIQEMLASNQGYLEQRNNSDMSLDAEDAANLILTNGKKVVDILKYDKVMEEQSLGISELRLWIEFQSNSDKRLSTNCRNYTFQYCGVHPVISLLKTSVEERDIAQIASILDSGILANVDLSDCATLPLFLCEQVFSFPQDILAPSAFRSLMSIYADTGTSVVPFSAVWLFRVLAALGADPTVLEQMGYEACDADNTVSISIDYRAESVLRLILLLKATAKSGRLEVNDIPDIIIAIQRILLDPSTSHQLCMDVTSLVDNLCNLATPDVDRRIYEKTTSFVFTLELPCRTRIISTFNRGSAPSRRIAKWLSYSTLTDQIFQRKDEEDIPPLEELLNIVESANIFRIYDNTDYNALWQYVQILSIVLTDVELYNAAERRTSVAQEQVGSPVRQKNKHRVTLIHESLERLHATIQDTRTLHLDRSRAKAAIKQLSLRLRYQHADLARDQKVGIPRRKTLDQFFSPKKERSAP
ncbi:hypothetical protein AX15_002776 [Amanita polypyramis BW_CC]|nr:hypothetical protein AX15_002776 [Amanita polypyramis BW_CC]